MKTGIIGLALLVAAPLFASDRLVMPVGAPATPGRGPGVARPSVSERPRPAARPSLAGQVAKDFADVKLARDRHRAAPDDAGLEADYHEQLVAAANRTAMLLESVRQAAPARCASLDAKIAALSTRRRDEATALEQDRSSLAAAVRKLDTEPRTALAGQVPDRDVAQTEALVRRIEASKLRFARLDARIQVHVQQRAAWARSPETVLRMQLALAGLARRAVSGAEKSRRGMREREDDANLGAIGQANEDIGGLMEPDEMEQDAGQP